MDLILKIIASGLYGLAAAAIGLSIMQILQSGAQAPRVTMVSMRRSERRQQMIRSNPLMALLMPFISNLGRLMARAELRVLRDYVRAPYARAGYPGGFEDDELVSVGMLMGSALSLLLAFFAWQLLGPEWSWLGMMGLPMGYLLLVSTLKSRADEREIQIVTAMPYMMDLLVLILRSGSSLGIALKRVVADYEAHPIGEELGQALAEIEVGAARVEAFRRMAERLDIDDLTSFCDSVVQSEELGWPLAETLERLADRLNSERVLRAQAKAGAAGSLVMIPSTMVMGSAVLLLFGPFIVPIMINGFKMD